MSLSDNVKQMIKESGFFQVSGERLYFYRFEGGRYKVIRLIDEWQDSVYNRHGIGEERSYCISLYDGMTADDALLLYITKKNPPVKSENVLYIDPDRNRVRGHCNRYFSPLGKRLKELFKADRYRDKMYESRYDTKERHGTWAVVLLIFINIYAAYKCGLWLTYSKYGISYYTVVSRHETYRLFTYMFMHNGIRHIFFNMLSLWYIGKELGQRTNGFSVLGVYLFGGITGAYASMNFNHSIGLSSRYTVGASGAIFALLGALIVCIIANPAERQNWKYIIKYAFVTLVCSAFTGGVDNACHIGGLIGGIAVMTLFALIGSALRSTKYVFSLDKVRKSER